MHLPTETANRTGIDFGGPSLDDCFERADGGSSVNASATGLVGLAVFIVWVRIANRHGAVPVVAVAFVAAGIIANTLDRVTVLTSFRQT